MWIKHHWLLSKRAYLIQNATVLAILWFWQRKVFHNRVLLILFQGSAQWLALNAMELVTSRLSAEEVNREPPLRRAQRVWWHVWRWGWGTCELRYCRPILGVSQSVPRGSPSTRTLSFRSLFRRTAAKVWRHQAGALGNLSLVQSRTCWYAQQREVHRLGEGRAEAGIRPDITPFKKHHSTRLCSALVALLSWLTVV